jgi:hypothetical protein
MADRLNNIAYTQHITSGNNHTPSNFNPRSVSLDIRTPEELAAVNEFLITLGRDVSTGGSRHPSHHQSPLHSGPNSFSPETYFDTVSLGQLGLAGMPGMPGSESNFLTDNAYPGNSSEHFQSFFHSSHPASRSSHPSVQPGHYGPIYPTMNDSPMTYSPPRTYSATQNARRPSGKYAHPTGSSFSSQHYQHPTPPLETGSPHSTVSTPVNSTPPQIPMSMPETSATFDYIRASRGTPPVPRLSPVDYMGKSMRSIVPLKAVPGSSTKYVGPSRPEPIEPKIITALHRGPPAKLTPSSVSLSSKPGSLYPLLTSGDVQYKLPPLNHLYRSPSPDSRESTPSSTHSSPITQVTILPSLHSIASPSLSGVRSKESDELTREIGRIELKNRTMEISAQDRRRHAELIRNLLVAINKDFKQRYGTPPVKLDTGHTRIATERSRDVEMTTA